MAYKEGIAEILERVSKIKSRKEKIQTLRKDHNIALENVIDLCFNPNLNMDLPTGAPPYKSQPKEMDAQPYLYGNLRKFGIFLKKGPYPDLKPAKREAVFIQFLEALDPDDAKLVIAIKDVSLLIES